MGICLSLNEVGYEKRIKTEALIYFRLKILNDDECTIDKRKWWYWLHSSHSALSLIPFWDCILYTNLKHSRNRGVLRMTINGIFWWGSRSEILVSVKYTFIAIIPRSTLTWSGNRCEGYISGSNTCIQKIIRMWLTISKKNVSLWPHG